MKKALSLAVLASLASTSAFASSVSCVPANAACTASLSLNEPLEVEFITAYGFPEIVLPISADDASRYDGVELRWQSEGNHDVDLFVRMDSPFALPADAVYGMAWGNVMNYAHGFAILAPAAGGFNDERVLLSRNQRFPFAEGPVYIRLSSTPEGSPSTARGTLTAVPRLKGEHGRFVADFTCPIDDATPWDDPVLGASRRAALNEAFEIASNELKPNIDIRVSACWTPHEIQGHTFPPNVFGAANFVVDTQVVAGRYQSPLNIAPHVVTDMGIRNHQAGTNTNNGFTQPTHSLLFNTSPLWSYNGSNPNGPDFTSAVLHALGHAVGFTSRRYTDWERRHRDPEAGSRASGTTPFDSNLVYIEDGTVKAMAAIPTFSAAESLYGDTSVPLFSASPSAVLDARNPNRDLPFPENLVRLTRPPSVFDTDDASPIEQSSTAFHLDASYSDELMTLGFDGRHRSFGLAKGILEEHGWKVDRFETLSVTDGQWFNPNTHLGRGIDLRKVAGSDLWFAVQYTYDEQGLPEFFTAVGDLVDGRFLPRFNAFGDTLIRSRYTAAGGLQEEASNLLVTMEFENAGKQFPCRRDYSPRFDDASLSLLHVSRTTSNSPASTCVEPLRVPTSGLVTDYSGIWYNPADPGWGITFVSFAGSGGDGLSGQVYYPDGNGQGRWAVFSTDRYVPGQAIDLLQVMNGGTATSWGPTDLELQKVGTLTPRLSVNGSTVDLDVGFTGTPDARFVKTNVPISLGSEPRF